MDFKETTLTAITALMSNKLRTGLAALGIIIGIGAVVALITLGAGATQSVTSSISSLGSNLLTISPNATNQGGIQGAAGSGTSLTLEDALAISTNPSVTDVSGVSAEAAKNFQLTAGRLNTNARVTGTLPAYLTIHDDTLSDGSFISQGDVNSLSRVIVIGATVATNLFPNGSPLGQTIQVNHLPFRVIGVLASKGGTGFGSVDDLAFVPITTAQKILLGTTTVQTISVAAKSADVMTAATDQIGYLLLSRHHLRDPAQADFTIRSQADILGAATAATGTLTSLLSGIAAISLLVGGIGIMNIMLVTITERTREIGIRKAIGAKRKDILTQFLLESIALTLVGGIIGILLGFALSLLGSNLLKIPFVISAFAPLLAFSVSSGIGIIFGYYPARRAAMMQPIEALRYE
jgi:putative ABC transport system permease protein